MPDIRRTGMRAWPVVKLGEICLKIGSGATPTGGNANYLPKRQNFAFVRSQNVYDRAFSEESLAFIDDDQAQKLRNVWLEPDDLLLNITGDGVTFSRCCLVPNAILPACVNQHVSIIRADNSKTTPGYLLSVLSLPAMKEYINSFNAGGSRRAITKANIESFDIPLPPLGEQRRIAAILSSLDDKIALNRATNQTLEQIAQALFQSWFVDFDPVRVKAEGRKPDGMDDETAALFPDSFEETELGMVPRRWEARPLYDVARFINGAPFREPDFSPDNRGLPIIKIAELKQGISDSTRFTEEEYEPRFKVTNGDIMYSWSGSPETSLDIFKWFGGDGWLNQHIFKLEFHHTEDEPFIYTLFQWLKPRLVAIAKDKQTTGLGHVTIGNMKSLLVVCPSRGVLQQFYRSIAPAYLKVSEHMEENVSLTSLRDGLLPKLLSGELVPDLRQDQNP